MDGEAANGKWRRKNFLVKKRFQLLFMARFLLLVAFACSAAGAVLYYLINREVEKVFYSNHFRLSSTGQVLLPTLLEVNFWVLAVLLFGAAVLILLFAQRSKLPFDSVGAAAGKVAAGDLTHEVRRSEELASLSNSFDRMSSELRERFVQLRLQTGEIEKAAERLLAHQAYSSRSMKCSVTEVDSRRINELLGAIAELEKNLGRFKT